ncbi:SAM-dependent methyltransferase [Ralstonia solanacearum]|uniref:SAM-dependent methyltransferase n=1 Tax=Ralstonia solanacearum TaxID=305 RepID=UPI00078D2E94|nr:cyclopropane-fatty-acyl-phospholipid synthase family protein [Ralstonia solanacearum]AMP40508.1 cyclopropane-mycolic acid synthase [Ralstonia solanacearum]AXV89367.1 class I SAM-dependent methyltransferase [Ralstonia solanacearum]AXW08830.1 class I SAM-dependent methyltransferase [Ralstonia solanacearum]AXW26614.1 class I SAM-dependent methyltransferase [Ralstonia solanacearum]AXW83530.1 class I SAM-dependent methyltransferase [Ralstonia solanacearum]
MATQADIAFHYDVDNHFYGLFLDRVHRAYSCAVWDGADTLEEAQQQKLSRLARFAGMAAGHHVLDIGCGWGGMLDYAVGVRGAATATGLTLSENQYSYVLDKAPSDITISLMSWRDFTPATRFDALVSIGAFEHFASLEDRDNSRHRQVYADFFAWSRAVSTDSARLGLQTIIAARAPESLEEVRDTRYLLKHVFPGSALPGMSDIQAGLQDHYDICECRHIGLDYARTLEQWRLRLQAHRTIIEARYGEALYQHYDHYFQAAERSFRAGVVNLAQLSLVPVRRAISFRR